MSEERVNHFELEPETCHEQGGPSTEDASSRGTSKPDLQGLVPCGDPSEAGFSPSPPAETAGLLSLPWEIITQIASYLPADCVINVLPKVCCSLGNLSKDVTAWQLRARRLIGSHANIPVGPREDFDWLVACLEMEQLRCCWTNQAHILARQTLQDEEDREQLRQQQRALQEGEHVADRQEELDLEGVEMAAQEVAYGFNEEMEVAMEADDDGIQPNVDEQQPVRLGEELEDRMEDDAAALIQEEVNHRIIFDGNEGQIGHEEVLVDPGNLGNIGQEDLAQHQIPRSPSPPPALECLTLPPGHIAQVNSVLLVGGKGAICATGSRDWNVKLWDLTAPGGKLLHTLAGPGNSSAHRGWVWCMASQGPLLASGGFDSTVRLWDLQANGANTRLIRAGGAVLCLSCQTDVLLAGTFDKRVSMYDTRAPELLVKSFRLHSNAVMCLAADDKYIISGGKDCTVAVYDCRAGKGLEKIRLTSYLLSMSYNGSEVWAGDNKGMLHSFSMQAGSLKPLSQFDVGHTAIVNGIHKTPGSLYTCSSDRTVKVHIPSAPPKTLCTLQHNAGVNGLSFDAGVLAVASGDFSVEIWRPKK